MNPSAQSLTPTVKDVGEQGVLRLVQRFCPAAIVGDDAAILTPPPDTSLVVTTDVLVDGVHFSVGLASAGMVTTSPADAGWRAVAANLSDLAAMGATPLGITIGLSLPGDCPLIWIQEMYQGMVDCLQPYGAAPIVGGDICRSSVLALAITAIGYVIPSQVIRRSTAKPGDAIVVTGYHGASRAGLELLLNPNAGKGLDPKHRTDLIRIHQRPTPRLDLLPTLHALRSTVSLSGMDSSDGLADAVLQICHASGVGARVNLRKLPIPPMFTGWLAPERAIDWTLYGGEDFELVLCLPPEDAEILVQRVGNGAAIVGSIHSDLHVILVDPQEEHPNQPLTMSRGFQHFA